MKSKILSFAAVALMAASGCATEVDQAAGASEEIGVVSQSLTIQECQAQRNTCVSRFGFLGALTICATQYTTCSAAATVLPDEVTDAIADAAACTETMQSCVVSATTPTQLAACAEAEAICVAGILNVELPEIVSGTSACVEGGVDCINAADSVSDLAGCGETLADCAIEQATSVIPEEVVNVVTDVTTCTTDLNACVLAASTPAELTQCSEESAYCVAGSLNVDLPDVPATEVVECTDTAADCALSAESLRDVAGCAEGLLDCTADVVASLEAPPVLDCAQVWTACMVRNPFNFFGCAAERRACENN